MMVVEWQREPQAKFWIPRRPVLEGKHKIATQIQKFIDDPNTMFQGFTTPPGTGKSTLIKFLLSYIGGKFPLSANMYVSYSDGMISMMYDAVKDIMTNPTEYLHNEVFNNGMPNCSAEYRTISFKKKGDFPTLGLVSIGGSVTGRTRANKILITDDLVSSPEMARSPTRLKKLNEDYRTLLTTRTIGENVKQIMLGTIWSVHDPISKMKSDFEDNPRYWFINIPVRDENGESNFEYNHPDRYTKESIADIESTIDPVDFSSLYLGRAMEKEGLVFAADTLRYYSGVLPDGEPDNILFFCDVAWGGGDNLSMPIGYQFGKDIYIHDVIFDRRDKFITKPRVVGKILQHRIKMGRFEADNGGHEYCDDTRRTLIEEHKYSCNLGHKKAPSTQAKMSRIEQHAPVIRTFYFIDDSSFDKDKPDRVYRDEDYKRFMNELTSISFTAYNPNDDSADSLAGFVDYFMGSPVSSVSYFPRTF